MGMGSRTVVQVATPYIFYPLPHFYSSVTDALEMCVAILQIVIKRHTATPLEEWRRVADRKLTEHSGSTRDISHLPGHLEQSWGEAYRKLRPLMACKILYYEATAIFFREKQFVLGSKQTPIFSSSLERSSSAGRIVEARPWSVVGGLEPREQFVKSWNHRKNVVHSTNKRY